MKKNEKMLRSKKEDVALQNRICVNRMWTSNGGCNWITTLKNDKNFMVKMSNEEIATQYSFKTYLIDVDRNFECGECLMEPGLKYRDVELKVSDNTCFNFAAGMNFDKKVFDAVVKSFIYHP